MLDPAAESTTAGSRALRSQSCLLGTPAQEGPIQTDSQGAPMTFELWEVAVVFVLGIWVGRNIQVWLTVETMKNNPRNMIDILERLEALDDQPEIELVAEVNNGQIYLWRKDTLEFVGQGKTIEEIIEQLTKHGDHGHYRISKEMVDKISAGLPK